MQFFPVCWFLIAAALPSLRAVELYSTDFSNFTPGADRIAGAPASGSSPAIPATDGWTGSHAGQDRSGILAEADHAIPGIGNAAYLGGNPNPIFTGTASMFVRKSFNYNPVTAGNEVVTIRVLAGLKDSTGLTRDNFDFLIYNIPTSTGGGQPMSQALAGIQFDNSRINPQTSSPYKAVYRYGYDTASQSVKYVDTGVTFVYDTLQELEIRINFRTNLWSAWLDTVPLFSDITCYIGPYARNLGSLLVQCRATSTFAPGSNYLLFDDLSINADPPDAVTAPELAFTTAARARLTWYQEAGYRYEIKYANTLSGPWLTGLPGAISTAGSTGFTGSLTDAAVSGVARRFYQLTRSPP